MREALLGRRGTSDPDDPSKLEFLRQRPGENIPTGDLTAPTLSRRQWRVRLQGEGLEVDNLGKRRLVHNGVATDSCRAEVGDTIGVEGVVLFLLARRSRTLPRAVGVEDFEFGGPDRDGFIGETPEAWRLRSELAFLRHSQAHVVVFGESGVGKELCAQAIHRGAQHRAAKLVSRNAATIPEGLVEAELFGNAPNYPHAGIAARAGLIGSADGGTLFLDEVGELPQSQQANLLRVLDAGEYQRLGEDRPRHSDLRVVAATNRPPEALKSDFLARFSERLTVPDLNARRADVPLLARAILKGLVSRGTPAGPLSLSLELTDALVRHSYTLHYRELERLLRLAWRHAGGSQLELGSLVAELKLPAPSVDVSAASISKALAESKNAHEAAKRLGLPSRFALYRLMKKFGVEQDS